jgi:hypothetical protein
MLTELTEVTPTLFISSATAITENKLQQLGITLIINATKGINTMRQSLVKKWL